MLIHALVVDDAQKLVLLLGQVGGGFSELAPDLLQLSLQLVVKFVNAHF